MNATETNLLLQNVAKLWDQCPNMRFGQLMATLGLMSDDKFGHSLWDVEDEEIQSVIEQFSEDLAERGHGGE